LPLVYLHEATPGKSHALNLALKKAKGEWVVFTDDDVVPSPEWLRTYAEAFGQVEQPAFFGGPIVSEFESGKPHELVLHLGPHSVRGLDHGDRQRELEAGEELIGPNWACPRAAMLEVGGFDVGKSLMPGRRPAVMEETVMMNALRRQGFRAVYLPGASIRHHVPKSKSTVEYVVNRLEQVAEATGHVDWQDRRAEVTQLRWRLRLDAARCRVKWWIGRLIRRPAYDSLARLCWIRGRLRGMDQAKRLVDSRSDL